ncbi:MAG: sigma-70 family RNA polymerase sigma factor [Anaeromicrobium sp.]|jgi:RNA polymerase sigma-70 factor (ECF subfamily)|uniref:sigma-70 family RNA polymerase sigma factor n=1 Tax=Anaeromicrobium sp. TaxID=1929132 RepID=UPI0025D64F0B|nr:sigma-70 family RNA polymerase sigma factor [Anaeromicrobium sp.]MCT4592832.1 sigma-70 family RNA polymerase sigma factor [Anaeromicrobium sp.]
MDQIIALDSLDEKKIEENLNKEKEFTYIFETYYKRIYNYIYYRVNGHYITEDLTSQVFEKLILKIGTYSESKSPFEVWLFAIARNVVNDHFRRIKKGKLFSLDMIKELISREKTPEDMVLTGEANDKLLKALNMLSIRDRNIVALKFGANLKNKEIAELLDITESNVGIILYRTMKKLKKEIEREG